MAGEYKSPCGCTIHVAQWTAKRKIVSQMRCTFHKQAEAVARELLKIMWTYHEQEATAFGVDTPGGLGNMGDVWSKFLEWETLLKAE